MKVLTLDSMNKSCGMIVRRVIEESPTLSSGLDDGLANTLPFGEDSEDCQTESADSETDVPDHLLQVRRFENGPEIFKRVRFLTRWQDADELRGPIYGTINETHFWYLTSHATYVGAQIRNKLIDDLYMGEWFRTKRYFDVIYTVLFVGKTRQQSYPVVVLYCKDKYELQRTKNMTRRLKWLQQSDILVLSCSGPVWKAIIYQEYIKGTNVLEIRIGESVRLATLEDMTRSL